VRSTALGGEFSREWRDLLEDIVSRSDYVLTRLDLSLSSISVQGDRGVYLHSQSLRISSSSPSPSTSLERGGSMCWTVVVSSNNIERGDIPKFTFTVCQERGPFEMIDTHAGVALSTRMAIPSTAVDLLVGTVNRVRVLNDQRATPVPNGECHEDNCHPTVNRLGQRCHPPAFEYDFQHIPNGGEMVTFRESRE